LIVDYGYGKEKGNEMTLGRRIDSAYSKIYSFGDEGLNYMEGHRAFDPELMNRFYDREAYCRLGLKSLNRLASMLEAIASDLDMDLEYVE
jgi:hypothetical protein